MKPNLRPGEPDSGREALAVALRNAYGTEGVLALEEAAEMPGGASTRRFFRVPLDKQTVVAMYMPLPSQEIAKAKQVTQTATFVEVQTLLRSRGVRVPKILNASAHPQLLLVEDLGDDTLALFLSKNEESRLDLYRKAVRDAARARSALSELPENSSILGRAFDKDLLLWEVEHFRDWALEARGFQLDETERKTFEDAAQYLATVIDSWPRGFVHRDYQSRNLMVRRANADLELVWIDFQDAMLGPRVYDLVALLTDSYQTFSRDFVEDRLKEYAEECGEKDLEQLLFEFDFVTVQRKLKDAGRFIFIDRVNGNPNFLEYVDGTIEKARRALARVAPRVRELRPLEELLTRLFGELSQP